ncbi:hypothetical protein EYF80_038523 [Liparis tanakae]|uniref:Uncharacterized protein n=1 Tax=Liparis tanakae TaxID=230148 RepID=A0A4Z2GF20_9TELE|nr:hypothetical protein EYF80_038523 [Liparis tanakae]
MGVRADVQLDDSFRLGALQPEGRTGSKTRTGEIHGKEMWTFEVAGLVPKGRQETRGRRNGGGREGLHHHRPGHSWPRTYSRLNKEDRRISAAPRLSTGPAEEEEEEEEEATGSPVYGEDKPTNVHN